MESHLAPSPVIVSIASDDVEVSDETRRAMHDPKPRASFVIRASTIGRPVPTDILRAVRASVLRVRQG